MKVLVEEKDNEGLMSLLGKTVWVFCMNYIYHGKLTGINATCIKLENPSIVYETGELSSKGIKDAQKLPGTTYIQMSAIESFGEK